MDASIYRMRQQDVLTVCVLALLSLGAVMVQSASTSLTGSIVRAPAADPDAPRPPGPAPLAHVMAATSPGGIDLTWAQTTDAATLTYRIYRADAADGPFAKYGEVRKPVTRFRDTAAPAGEPRHYRVVGVDDTGREGPPAVLTATRPGKWVWTPLATRHLTYVAVAFAAFILIGYVDYNRLVGADGPWWKSPILVATAVAAVACLLVLVPGIGTAVNGARRWIKLGPVQIQPSELAKWATVLFLAWWFTRPSVRPASFAFGFLPAAAVVGVLCLLVVIQDFGTAALIGACALTLFLAGRVRLWHLAVIAVPALMAAAWFIADKEYRVRRILAFRDPYASPQGEGYHMIQSLLSFSTGGVLGRGLGNGVQKLGYLPEDTTDFIFAVICEELGLFGALLTVVLYMGVLYVAWQAVKQHRDDFGRMLAFGVGSMLGLQAMINIAVATVSMPTKGLSLPLISAGGSGLVITCAALGVLRSVTRSGTAKAVDRHDGEADAATAGEEAAPRRAVAAAGSRRAA